MLCAEDLESDDPTPRKGDDIDDRGTALVSKARAPGADESTGRHRIGCASNPTHIGAWNPENAAPSCGAGR